MGEVDTLDHGGASKPHFSGRRCLKDGRSMAGTSGSPTSHCCRLLLVYSPLIANFPCWLPPTTWFNHCCLILFSLFKGSEQDKQIQNHMLDGRKLCPTNINNPLDPIKHVQPIKQPLGANPLDHPLDPIFSSVQPHWHLGLGCLYQGQGLVHLEKTFLLGALECFKKYGWFKLCTYISI